MGWVDIIQMTFLCLGHMLPAYTMTGIASLICN